MPDAREHPLDLVLGVRDVAQAQAPLCTYSVRSFTCWR